MRGGTRRRGSGLIPLLPAREKGVGRQAREGQSARLPSSWAPGASDRQERPRVCL